MKYLLPILLCCSLHNAWSQTGWQIKIKIDQYTDTLFFGIQRGVRQIPLDTAFVGADGNFVFEADTLLPEGVYLLMYQKEKKREAIQLIMTPQQPKIAMMTALPKPYRNARVSNSPENVQFFRYLAFIDEYTPDDASQGLYDFQQKLLNDPKLPPITAKIIKNMVIPLPDKVVSDTIAWKIKHGIDNIDFTNDHFLRVPFIFHRMEDYVFKWLPQDGDSLLTVVDTILKKCRPNYENFHYVLPYFLNTFSRSTYPNFDKVYVHLAQDYYGKGDAAWMSNENLKKIMDNAAITENILVGKIAPNIKMFQKDSSIISLHSVQAAYTILVIWDPDCGHCVREIPVLKELYEEYKDKDLKVFAICHKTTDSVSRCWDFIKKNGMENWINVVDPLQVSRYRTKYDVKNTPHLYILDKDKKIVFKRLGEALDIKEIMSKIYMK